MIINYLLRRFKKDTLTFVGTSLLFGCSQMVDYTNPPEGAIKYGSGARAVKPIIYAVESRKFPKFKVRKQFTPPRNLTVGFDSHFEMMDLYESDIWNVTHNVNGHYIIQSEEYRDRQCRYLETKGRHGSAGGFIPLFSNKCLSERFGIYITLDGYIDGGWQRLPSKQHPSNREYLNPDPKKNEGWPTGIIFINVKPAM